MPSDFLDLIPRQEIREQEAGAVKADVRPTPPVASLWAGSGLTLKTPLLPGGAVSFALALHVAMTTPFPRLFLVLGMGAVVYE